MADGFDVVAQPDDFVLVDNSDDWTIYTPVDAEYTVEFQSVGLNDAAITVAARDAAIAAQIQADADRVQTGLDRTQTGLDKAATAADRVQTGLDRTQTSADRVQTGLDRTQTGLDKTATAADRVQTGLDRTQTGLDKAATAADRVQTGLDRTQTGIDRANITAMVADMAGGTTNQILAKQTNADYDFQWMNPTGMLTAIYDPNGHLADAFNRANHTGTQLAATISNFNTAADARIAAAVGVSVQGYTAILAGTTASYTVALDTKLGGIATGADVTVSALAPAIHGAAAKATPVDADELALSDSAAAFGLKKLTWAQVKATLKTYFDTLHGSLAAANTWAARNVFVGGGTGNSTMATATASLGEIETRGNGTGAAMAAFHRPGSFAAYFGIDTDNVWKVGGWSMGAVAYKVWHEGSDGAGSGLDADLLDGLNSASAATVSTIAARDAQGDITTRLFRTEYAAGGGTGAYFLTQNAIGSGADNYARPMDLATAKTTLGIGSMANRSVTISAAAPSGGVDGDVWFQI